MINQLMKNVFAFYDENLTSTSRINVNNSFLQGDIRTGGTLNLTNSTLVLPSVNTGNGYIRNFNSNNSVLKVF